jgi:hypothetical protein
LIDRHYLYSLDISRLSSVCAIPSLIVISACPSRLGSWKGRTPCGRSRIPPNPSWGWPC